jgi:phytoene dehydrogenase-like protein
MSDAHFDAIVVGSGPNGLAAAVTMARAGFKVKVFEACATAGGGMRSEELTLPGFIHDVCSAVHPLAVTSPFFSSIPLEEHGLKWIYPPLALAHPLDGPVAEKAGSVVVLETSVRATAANLGEDEKAYSALMEPLVAHWQELFAEVLQPLVHLPRKPFLLARFGYKALLSAKDFAQIFFRGERARALFAGVAAHANCPLTRPGTAGLALTLILAAHARGWPIPQGGSQAIANALISYLSSLGGVIEANHRIASIDELPPARWTFFDVAPSRLHDLLGQKFAARLARRFKDFRQGPGVFKIDWCLAGPIPWMAERSASAGTIHLGGTIIEIVRAEAKPESGKWSDQPYVLLSQPSLFDSLRVPAPARGEAARGRQTAWAYCHVPNGSVRDMTGAVESQIERFAPGFRSRILRRSVLNTSDLQRRNENLVGGDISGGAFSLWQMISPTLHGFDPYVLSAEDGYFLCSSSTPPGPGVHGMCGYLAARKALKLTGHKISDI